MEDEVNKGKKKEEKRKELEECIKIMAGILQM